MALSAVELNKAEEHLTSAWRILLKQAQSRKWDTRKEIDTLISVINEVERVQLSLLRLETSTHGFDYWQEIEREESDLRKKRLANKHCKAMGLVIPFPEVENMKGE